MAGCYKIIVATNTPTIASLDMTSSGLVEGHLVRYQLLYLFTSPSRLFAAIRHHSCLLVGYSLLCSQWAICHVLTLLIYLYVGHSPVGRLQVGHSPVPQPLLQLQKGSTTYKIPSMCLWLKPILYEIIYYK